MPAIPKYPRHAWIINMRGVNHARLNVAYPNLCAAIRAAKVIMMEIGGYGTESPTISSGVLKSHPTSTPISLSAPRIVAWMVEYDPEGEFHKWVNPQGVEIKTRF